MLKGNLTVTPDLLSLTGPLCSLGLMGSPLEWRLPWTARCLCLSVFECTRFHFDISSEQNLQLGHGTCPAALQTSNRVPSMYGVLNDSSLR